MLKGDYGNKLVVNDTYTFYRYDTVSTYIYYDYELDPNGISFTYVVDTTAASVAKDITVSTDEVKFNSMSAFFAANKNDSKFFGKVVIDDGLITSIKIY